MIVQTLLENKSKKTCRTSDKVEGCNREKYVIVLSDSHLVKQCKGLRRCFVKVNSILY